MWGDREAMVIWSIKQWVFKRNDDECGGWKVGMVIYMLGSHVIGIFITRMINRSWLISNRTRILKTTRFAQFSPVTSVSGLLFAPLKPWTKTIPNFLVSSRPRPKLQRLRLLVHSCQQYHTWWQPFKLQLSKGSFDLSGNQSWVQVKWQRIRIREMNQEYRAHNGL